MSASNRSAKRRAARMASRRRTGSSASPSLKPYTLDALPQIAADPLVQRLNISKADLEVERVQLKNRYKEGHPKGQESRHANRATAGRDKRASGENRRRHAGRLPAASAPRARVARPPSTRSAKSRSKTAAKRSSSKCSNERPYPTRASTKRSCRRSRRRTSPRACARTTFRSSSARAFLSFPSDRNLRRLSRSHSFSGSSPAAGSSCCATISTIR